jgi:REP element-mobilizing transposase RayT
MASRTCSTTPRVDIGALSRGWAATPRYRDALQRHQAIFEKVCRDLEAQLVEMNGAAKHVHLLIHYPPKHSVSSLVNSLKGVSSRLLCIEPPDMEKRYWNCPVVAFLLRRQLWRGTAGHY